MDETTRTKLEDRKAELKTIFDSLTAKHSETLSTIKQAENEIQKIESSILRIQGAYDEVEKLLNPDTTPTDKGSDEDLTVINK
jgi:esterase/lipase